VNPADPQGDGARDRAIARFASAPEHADAVSTTPEDAAALKQVSEVWRDLDGVAEHPAIKAMRAQALARLEAGSPAETARAPLARAGDGGSGRIAGGGGGAGDDLAPGPAGGLFRRWADHRQWPAFTA
jgi:hypothetical protein